MNYRDNLFHFFIVSGVHNDNFTLIRFICSNKIIQNFKYSRNKLRYNVRNFQYKEFLTENPPNRPFRTIFHENLVKRKILTLGELMFTEHYKFFALNHLVAIILNTSLLKVTLFTIEFQILNAKLPLSIPNFSI